MGVIFIDSFDHYPTASIGVKWNGNTPSNASVSALAARNGSQGLQIVTTGSATSGYLAWNVGANKTATGYFGFALRLDNLPTGNSTICFISDSSGVSNTGIEIQVTSTGQLRIFVVHSNGLHDNWTGTALTTGTWYYVEVKYKPILSSATGDVEIKVDYGSGPTVVNQITSAQQTYATNANWHYIGFGGLTSRSAWSFNSNCFKIDDVYIIDSSSGTNTSYLGNSRVDVVYPDGAGASAQWTPNQAGHANYTEVNEASADGDTTYVSTTGVGNRDSYTIGSLPSSPVGIYCVQVVAWGKDDTGGSSHAITASLRIGATYYDFANFTVNGSSYRYYPGVWETNPATSLAFTMSDIDNMEAGIKLVS